MTKKPSWSKVLHCKGFFKISCKFIPKFLTPYTDIHRKFKNIESKCTSRSNKTKSSHKIYPPLSGISQNLNWRKAGNESRSVGVHTIHKNVSRHTCCMIYKLFHWKCHIFWHVIPTDQEFDLILIISHKIFLYSRAWTESNAKLAPLETRWEIVTCTSSGARFSVMDRGLLPLFESKQKH